MGHGRGPRGGYCSRRFLQIGIGFMFIANVVQYRASLHKTDEINAVTRRHTSEGIKQNALLKRYKVAADEIRLELMAALESCQSNTSTVESRLRAAEGRLHVLTTASVQGGAAGSAGKAAGDPEHCDPCLSCKAGSPADGGLLLSRQGRCQAFCSTNGFCGHGDAYEKPGSMDCATCTVVADPIICETCSMCRPHANHSSSFEANGGCLTSCSVDGICDTGGDGLNCQPCVKRVHLQIQKTWAIVLPFSGSADTHRMRVVNASWYSLCRAMRAAPPHHQFLVYAIDNSEDDFGSQDEQNEWVVSWRTRCQTPRLKSLVRVPGSGDPLTDIKEGFTWASDLVRPRADWVINIESDMLLVEGYFFHMARDYRLALSACPTPTLSGYASNTGEFGDHQLLGTFSSNLMFDPTNLKRLMGEWREEHVACLPCIECQPGEPGIELFKGTCLNYCALSNRSCGLSEWHQGPGSVACSTCENAPRWPSLLRDAARRACRQRHWPRIPLNSYTRHMGFEAGDLDQGRSGVVETDPVVLRKMAMWGGDSGDVTSQSRLGGFHFERDLLDERGLRFTFDDYNRQLIHDLEPQPPSGVTALRPELAPSTNASLCFDGPHEGYFLLSCAVDDSVVFRSCLTFNKLVRAQSACLQFDSCGGVTEMYDGVFTLRVGSKLAHVPGSRECRQWIMPRSWVRRRVHTIPTTAAGEGHGEGEVWQRCAVTPLPAMRKALRCAECSACEAGSHRDGGVDLAGHGDVCQAFCSSSGFCGSSYGYTSQGTDCRDCKQSYDLGTVNSDGIGPFLMGLIKPIQRVGTFGVVNFGGLRQRRQILGSLSAPVPARLSQRGAVSLKALQLRSRDSNPRLFRPAFESTGVDPPRKPGGGVVLVTKWGIVLPFHGKPGSDRLRMMNATWQSLCRAMSYADRGKRTAYEFNVLAIDDTGTRRNASDHPKDIHVDLSAEWKQTMTHIDVPNFENAQLQSRWVAQWRRSCASPNLKILERVEGRKNISHNIQMGYDWGARHGDFITNLDSDLLVTESFFLDLERDYWRQRERCDAPAISGYTSNIMPVSYGANFMFARHAYKVWVQRVSEPVVEAWDTKFGELHCQVCGVWPTRPNSSYAHHMALRDSLHYKRDGDKESGLRFPWDVRNMLLKQTVDHVYGARFYQLAKLKGLSTTVDAACFDGPHEGLILRHCATNANHATGVRQSPTVCVEFESLTDAQTACLRWESCGGVVFNSAFKKYTLHSTTKLENSAVTLKNCRLAVDVSSWIRRPSVGGAACVADPRVMSPGEQKVAQHWREVELGMVELPDLFFFVELTDHED